MKGQLTEHPLVEIIREISSKGLSGTLRLKLGRAQAAIYFEGGELVFAASNLRTLRLRPYLEQKTSLTSQDLDRLGADLTDAALSRALATTGIMSPEQVEALMASLVSDLLRVLLLWTDAEWEFDVRARLDESTRVRVDVSNLLREAAHRLPIQLPSSRLLNPREKLSRVSMVSKVKDFLPAESFLLSRLDMPMTLSDLVAISGLRELEAHRVIYGLALSGFVSRENWQNAFRTAETTPERDASASPLFASEFEESKAEDEIEMFVNRVTGAGDHYETLDLGLNADASEVKDAYYSLARRYHRTGFI